MRLDARICKGHVAMKTTKAVRFGNIAIAAITGFLLTLPVQAEIKSHSGNLIVEQPADLPQMAQTPGQAFFLYQAGNGETYLYVEQQNGARLAVFDVTSPAKVKAVSSVAINAGGAFDFVRPLSDQAELIRFRDNQQVAMLDLHKPKSPTLKITNAVEQGHTESSGETGFLVVSGRYKYVSGVAHDYQVVDNSNPAGPTPLATIKQVKHTIVDGDTGTTYLLGSDGLTVIRRLRVEEDYEIHQMQMEPN
jgi:LVIVD repeat